MAIGSAPTNGAGAGESFRHQTGTQTNFAMAVAPTNGRTLIVQASAQNAQALAGPAASPAGIVQTGVTWTRLFVTNAVYGSVEVWKGVVGPGASATIQVNSLISGATANIRFTVTEWTGNPSVIDASAQSAVALNGGATSTTSGSITPTNGVDVLILAGVRSQNGVSGSPTAGFTDLANGGSTGYRYAYRRVTASTSYSWGYGTQVSGGYESAIIALKEPAAAVLANSFASQPGTTASGATIGTFTVQATTDGAPDPAASGLTCTLTLVGPFGSLTNLTAVHNSTGLASFSTSVPTGDGLYTISAVTPGYTAATSNPFGIVGTALASVQTLITAFGGDAVTPGAWERRLNVGVISAKVATIGDAVGPIGGRTAGPDMVQATAGQRPGFSGTQGSGSERITLTASNSEHLATTLQAAFALSPTTPVCIWACGKSTSANGPLAGVVASVTSSTTFPIAVLGGFGSMWKARIVTDNSAATSTAAGAVDAELATANTDGVRRGLLVCKDSHMGNNADEYWRAGLAGRQLRRHAVMTPATAGSLAAVIGRLGSQFLDGEFDCLFITTAAATGAMLRAWHTYITGQHGATLETAEYGSIVQTGSSIPRGSSSGSAGADPLHPSVGTGTTTAPYLWWHSSTGGPTMLSRGYTPDVHAYNLGASGYGIDDLIARYPFDVGVLKDNARRGRKVNVCLAAIGNSIQGLGYSAATYLAKLATYYALHVADGIELVFTTEMDRGSGANGSNGNATGWWLASSGSTKSAYGLVIDSIHATLRAAAPGTYFDRLWDIEGEPLQRWAMVRTGGARASDDASIYNVANSDRTHLSLPGYAALGQLEKNLFEAAYFPTLSAGLGVFAETGRAATLRASRRISSARGTYLETASAAGLQYSGATGRSLNASRGTYVLAGTSAGLRVSRRVRGAAGAVAWTGRAVTVRAARRLTAARRAFLVTGVPASLVGPAIGGSALAKMPTWVDAAPTRTSVSSS